MKQHIEKVRTFWKEKNLAPPHQILRRLIFVIPTYIFGALFLATAALGWGLDTAQELKGRIFN